MSRQMLALFPEEFFYTTRISGKCGISPAASFDPIAGYDSNNAFQSSTTPSAVKKPKNLILCGKTMRSFQKANIVALIDFLCRGGFTLLYTLHNNSPKFVSFGNAQTCQDHFIHFRVGDINQGSVYEEIYQQMNIPHGHLLLLDETRIADLFRRFEKSNQRIHPRVFANPFKMTLCAPERSQMSSPVSRYGYLRFLEACNAGNIAQHSQNAEDNLALSVLLIAYASNTLSDDSASALVKYIATHKAGDVAAVIKAIFEHYGSEKNSIMQQRILRLIDYFVGEPAFFKALATTRYLQSLLHLAVIHPEGILQALETMDCTFSFSCPVTQTIQLIQSLRKIPDCLLDTLCDDLAMHAEEFDRTLLISHEHCFQLIKHHKMVDNMIQRQRQRQLHRDDMLCTLWPLDILKLYQELYQDYTNNRPVDDKQILLRLEPYCFDHTHRELVYFHFPQLKKLLEENQKSSVVQYWLRQDRYNSPEIFADLLRRFDQHNTQDCQYISGFVSRCLRKSTLTNPGLLDAIFSNERLLAQMDRIDIEKWIFLYANPVDKHMLRMSDYNTVPPNWFWLDSIMSRFIGRYYQDPLEWIDKYYDQNKYCRMIQQLTNGTLWETLHSVLSIQHSYFIKLISDMSIKRYFKIENLLALAKHDILLAKAILITYGDEYKPLFTRKELASIVLLYPSLSSHLKEALARKEDCAEISCAPSILEIFYDKTFLSDFQDDACSEKFVHNIAKNLHVNLENIATITLIFTDITDIYGELYSKNILTIMTVFKTHCPNLRYIYTPKALFRQLYDAFSPKIIVRVSDYRGTTQESKTLARTLYVTKGLSDAQGDMSSNTGQDHQNYLMYAAGEMLTQDITVMPRVRTGLLSYACQEGFFQKKKVIQKKIIPRVFSDVKVRYFTNFQNIIRICRAAQDDFCYILFTVKLQKNQRTRLLSINAQETLGYTSAQVGIAKGEDGFFYAQSTSDITLSYILCVDRKFIFNDSLQDHLPSADPVRQIIDEYCDATKGFRKVADPSKSVPLIANEKNYADWCEALFAQRAGVCWHRSLAVYEKLRTKGHGGRVQIVSIDGTHVVLEVLYEGVRYCVDLGGGANATLTYHTAEGREISEADIALARETACVPKVKEPSTEASKTNNTVGKNVSASQPIADAAYSQSPEEIRKAKLKSILVKKNAVEKYHSMTAFFELLDKELPKTLLISTRHVSETANELLKTFTRCGIDMFYIDSSALIVSNKACVQINAHMHPGVSEKTPLEIFLLQANAKQSVCVLLIDIRSEKLPAEKLVAINTCVDNGKRTLCGVDVTDNMLVISLDNRCSQDASFISRQQHLIEWHVPVLPAKHIAHNTMPVTVYDLRGYSDWKKALFGRAILQDNAMQWHPTAFVEIMKRKEPIHIELVHFPEETRKELCYFIAQSSAKGYFDYHGYHVPFDENIEVTCGKNAYDFSTMQVESVVCNDHVSCMRENDWLINTYTFDFLLHDKKIGQDKHFDTPGLLQRYSDKPFSLYISSPFTEAQWWCLLQEAKQNHVKLSLHLLPGVELPAGIQISTSCNLPDVVTQFRNNTITITNSPAAVLYEIRQTQEVFATVDVEDFTFQDLSYTTLYRRTQTGYDNFQLKIGDLLHALQNNKTVVLKGEFSPALLAYFDTWLLPQPYVVINEEKQYFNGKLQLIVEDSEFSDRCESIYQDILKWLTHDGQKIQTRYIPPVPKAPVICPYNESRFPVSDDSLEPSDGAFIKRRKDALFGTLQNHAMVQLVGHSGVGKSRVMQALEVTDQDRCTVYRELDNIEKWATDNSDKLKILFIDESNIDDKHYTMFSQLKKGGDRKILVNGKLIQLTDKHKVVFARNPHDYGGGRAPQKLFADNSIPELHFSDFTPAYIYHEILKPIADAAGIEKRVTPGAIQEDCKIFIDAYLARNKIPSHKDHMTVRELQQKFLSYCVAHLNRTTILGFCQSFLFHTKCASTFVITKTAESACSQMELFIQIKKYQRIGTLPADIGLNGMLIEGKPSVGKSAAIEYMFKKMNITDFIKIDASVLLDEKKRLLLAAFRAGKPVWLDEINACLDDGLEKWLNKILTGEDPDTGLPSPKPGCFVAMSANGADLEGRSNISPALRHRCVNINLQKPTCEDVQKILETKHADPTAIVSLAQDFVALQNETSDVTLRGLLAQHEACLAMYSHDSTTACAIPHQ